MKGERKGLFRNRIRLLFEVGPASALTDGQLLERFATRRDEGAELAFAALVERHGPMVVRVCRGILRDEHEAMDAFQATFLVLARHGGSLWVRDSIGPWLHRVAFRAAGRARRMAVRRRDLETKMAAMAEPGEGYTRDDDRFEVAAVVHEEVDRLPERYRAAVVLCDLDGRTCEDAARHLGCPVGTVASRLARGRERLRERLARRGFGSAAVLGQGARLPLPATLVDATAAAAARFVSTQAVRQGAAAILALEVLRVMAVARWFKLGIVVLAVSASTSGVVSLAGRSAAVAQKPAEDARAAGQDAFTAVQPGAFDLVIEELGNVVAVNALDVFCKVEGTPRIIALVPEGKRVSRGDVICELDSAVLRVDRARQQSAVADASAVYANARRAREVAEMALKEYVEGVQPHELRSLSSEVALAESAVTRANERLTRTREARAQVAAMVAAKGGEKTPSDVMVALKLEDRVAAAEQDLGRERESLEDARGRRDVYERFTREKTTKRRSLEVEATQAADRAAWSNWKQADSRAAWLQDQVAACRMLAPSDGILQYATDSNTQRSIQKGATLTERQRVFSVVDIDGPFRVNAWVREGWVDKILPGQTVRVKVDAFADVTLAGVVESVAPRPDPVRRGGDPSIKLYSTSITLKDRVRGLRPGMTATAEIVMAHVDNAFSVPISAVVEYDDAYRVAVKTADGRIDWRTVTLGRGDDRKIEVKQGLHAGDNVAVDPNPLLSDNQRERVKTQRVLSAIPRRLRVALDRLPREDRARLGDATAAERRSILLKAGLSEESIRLYERVRQRLARPDGP